MDIKTASRTEGPPTAAPITKTISGATASPATLARIVVARFAEQVPFDRQEQALAREGFPVARGTLAEWAEECHDLGRAVVEAMVVDAIADAGVIATDASGLLVQNPGGSKRGHFWIAVADRDHVFLRYAPRQAKAAPDDLFAGFRGHWQADAAAVYEAIVRGEDGANEVDWTQVRRSFLEAAKEQRETAMVAVGIVEKLFAVDRELRELPPARRVESRRARAAPLLDQLAQWKDRQFASPTFAARSPLARALVALDRSWGALTRFLADGRIRFDDNPNEAEVRRLVMGRRNWLFVGGDDDVPMTCTFVSLVASARLQALEPEVYLCDLFRILPGWPPDRVLELAPKYWNRTRERLDPAELDATLGPVTVPPREIREARGPR